MINQGIDLSSAQLFKLTDEVVKWQTLMTAIELKIFDSLSTPKTGAELSKELETHPANTELLLNALTAMGCLRKSANSYQNTPSAEACWKSTSKTSLCQSFSLSAKWISGIMSGGMTELVKFGKTEIAEKKDFAKEEMWRNSAYAILNFARCSRAEALADIISNLPEFPSFSTMLDAGAGPGILSIAVAGRSDKLECTLLDLPAVCDVAEETIQEYKLEDRFTTIRGELQSTDIGTGYDFILASNSLNFFKQNMQPIIEKFYNALNPGGILMTITDGMSPSRTAPLPTVLNWLVPSMQGMDLAFECGELSGLMLNAGFTSTSSRIVNDIPLDSHGQSEITIGRKK